MCLLYYVKLNLYFGCICAIEYDWCRLNVLLMLCTCYVDDWVLFYGYFVDDTCVLKLIDFLGVLICDYVDMCH